MSVFDDLFESAAAPAMLDQFGESIVYRPAGGTPRPITAIVDRDPPADLVGLGTAPAFLVQVLNDGTSGILVTELDTGGDKIDVAEQVGGTAETRAIGKLMKQTGGMLTLSLR